MELHSELPSLADLSAMVAEIDARDVKATISPCPECQKNFRTGSLKSYHVNLEESLVFCDNDMCCYTGDPPIKLPELKAILNPDPEPDLNELLCSFLTDELEHINPFESPSKADISALMESPTTPLSVLTEPSQTSQPKNTNSNASIVSPNHLDIPANDAVRKLCVWEENSTTSMALTPDNPDIQHTETTLDNSPNFLSPVSDSLSSSSCSSASNDCVSFAQPKCSSIRQTDTACAGTDSAVVVSDCDTLATPLSTPMEFSVSATVSAELHHSYHSDEYRYIMLWKNIDALCWLDVLLASLCNNQSLRSLSQSLPYSSIIKKLLLAYDESQALIEPLQMGDKRLLHSVMECDEPSVKRGGGHCADSPSALADAVSQASVLTRPEINSAKRKVHLAGIKLECVREEIWQALEPTLRCERGKDDSPVFAFPLLVRADKRIEELFLTEYSWRVQCATCRHEQVTREKKPMITFPKIGQLEMNSSMFHYRPCMVCHAPKQKRHLTISKLAANLVMHFAEGLTDSDIDALSFTAHDGARYTVSGVVEYKTSPSHFALWQRPVSHNHLGKWMCYDDLRSQYAQFSRDALSMPASSVHIVFWECVHREDNSAAITTRPKPKENALASTTSKKSKTLSSDRPTAKQKEAASNMNNSTNICSSQSLASVVAAAAPPSYSTPQSAMEQAISPTITLNASAVAEVVSGSDSTVVTKAMSTSKLYATTVLSTPTITPTPTITSTPTVPSAATAKGNRKTVSLLSRKIGTNKSLSAGLAYGNSTPGASAVGQGSYKQIVSALNAATPAVSNDVNPQSTCNSGQRPQPSKFASNKSYLDMVQPLLLKNKQQNGKILSGYVPKSKRDDTEKANLAKRKKVMFTEVSNKVPKSCVPSVSKPGDCAAASTDVPVPKPHRKYIVTGIVDDFVQYTPKVLTKSPEELTKSQEKEMSMQDLGTVDMPSLNDIFGDM